ncbi:cytidine deaminase [bacterium]|nr:MAG: cytidine deaminase [bacterium]
MKQQITWEIVLQRSYVPYSKKPACAVCIDENGGFHVGVRIENAAFPETISSAQAAVYSCLASGNTPKELIYPFLHPDEHMQYAYLEKEYRLSVYQQDEISIEYDAPFQHFEKLGITELKALVPFAKIQHSNFPVAAYLQTEKGSISGVNIENSDWRLGLCAERVALCRAISNGAEQMGELFVFTPKAEYCSPCGGCRQVINEHLPESRLHLYHKDETHSEIIAKYLLPHSFSSSALGN